MDEYMAKTSPEQVASELEALGVELVPTIPDNYTILFEIIVGSQAFGTNTPESDEDRAYVYYQPLEDILGFGYVPFIQLTKDIKAFEIQRFIELLMDANATTLEILYSPEDCIIYQHPAFNILMENRDKFLTKKCEKSFGGFAVQQIKRSKGQNKKMNWEKEKTERKDVLDFCYVFEKGQSLSIKQYLEKNKLKQEYCGLAKVDHMPNCYALYYDDVCDTFDMDSSFKGIIGEDSNDVRLTSIPKDDKCLTILYFNKDAYSIHCKEYREYQEWLQKRNMTRFVENKEHGQEYDGKNLLHSRRLVNMAMEIPKLGTLNIRRSPDEVKYLLQIKKGEINLEEIIVNAEKDLSLLPVLYQGSNLPDFCDQSLGNGLLVKIRKILYSI